MSFVIIDTFVPTNSSGSQIGPPLTQDGLQDPGSIWAINTSAEVISTVSESTGWNFPVLFGDSPLPDSQVVIRFTGIVNNFYALIRGSTSGGNTTGYAVGITNNAGNPIYCFKVVSGTLTQVGANGPNTTLSSVLTYDLLGSVTGTGISVAIYTVTNPSTDAPASGTLLYSNSWSDSSVTGNGTGGWFGYQQTTILIDKAWLYSDAVIVLSPTFVTINSSVAMTATGAGTSWVNGTTTFSVSGGSGASISGLSINNSTQVASFTLNTGTQAGLLTITDSSDSLSATVYAYILISPTSTARLESPAAWANQGGGRTGGSERETWRVGNWVNYYWSTTNATPLAILNVNNGTSGSTVSLILNGTLIDGLTLNSSGGINITSYLNGAGTYVLQVIYRQSQQNSRWNYTNALVDSGLLIDADGTPGTAPAIGNWIWLVGDSITEGIEADNGSDDNLDDYSFLVGQALTNIGYNYALDACGYRGYLETGDSGGDVPAWYLVDSGGYEPSSSGWNKIDGSNSLLDSNSQISAYGATNTTPSLILINFGSNETIQSANTTYLRTAVKDALVSLRGAAPNTELIILLFFGAYTGWTNPSTISAATAATYATAIRNGFSDYQSSYPSDAKVKLIDLGSVQSNYIQSLTPGYLHPGITGHAYIAALITALLTQVLF